MSIFDLENKKWKPGEWILINKLQWGLPEIQQLEKVLDTDWFGGNGAFNEEFESKIKRFTGAKYFQSTNSGSSALEIAIQIFIQKGIWKPGDKILHPALTFPTSISAAIMAGLVPIYMDVEPGTYVISSEKMKQAFVDYPEIKGAIIPLLIGNVPDMDLLKELLGDRPLIVDSCDTIGSQWREKEAGLYGDIFTYSFYGSHHISTFGVGGGFGTNNPEYYELGKSLAFWGRDFDVENGDRLTSFLRRYSYKTIGFDAQMSAVQAAFGSAQMDRLPEYIGQRASLFRKLQQLFAKHSDSVIQPVRVSDKADPSWFCYPITLKKKSAFTREEIVNYLLDNKIEIRPVMALLPDQIPYQNVPHYIVGDIQDALDVANRGFFIPCFPMSNEQEEEYLWTLRGFLDHYE